MPVKVCASSWDVQFAGSMLGIPGFASPDSGGCPSSAVAQGIRYAADNGAKVINLSLGGTSSSQTEQDAILYAVSKGVFVAIAAGNDYDDGNPTQYPAAYAPGLDGVMAVGSVGRSLRRAYYSSTGAYVEIAAPGGDEKEGGASGGIWQTTIFEPDSDPELVVFPRFDRYAETPFQGTSMASPHVAGVAALIISRLGAGATPAVIERIIKASARTCDAIDCDPATPRSGAAGRNDSFGFGLIQPRDALLGFGFAR
jgi:serine protease